MSDNTPIKVPAAERGGLIPTLNAMGYMTSSLDPFSEEFVRLAAKQEDWSLEVGTAYGVATLKALSAGAKIIANDADERHLSILSQLATEKGLNHQLKILHGHFPEELTLDAGSISSILVCRVLHFFEGPKIELSAKKMLEWLRPGGKAFIVAETPYLKPLGKFIPEYESRKKAGHPWPGLIDDYAKYVPRRAVVLPQMMHFLDKEVLERVFRSAGFIIERLEFIPRPEFPDDLRLDGRESVGLVARKNI